MKFDKNVALGTAAGFLVGTVMGGFLIKLAFILAAVAIVGYVAYTGYTLYKKGAFSK